MTAYKIADLSMYTYSLSIFSIITTASMRNEQRFHNGQTMSPYLIAATLI